MSWRVVKVNTKNEDEVGRILDDENVTLVEVNRITFELDWTVAEFVSSTNLDSIIVEGQPGMFEEETAGYTEVELERFV